ncbi:MAG: SDR family NAD(P)-dependent oxidoreductase [Chloroherpetonaceae bacterium]|nr:SDR family NAD(P)-dependent oxidoreductase [Chloroherpetonaceae bacterium]MCS7210533.1 SDR family NAD(P)-dependent oxidoreductase [Chloroherpetonaceae bacterium]MDW8020984.1 SDR family NAD(P)-dependent oxidoreductase [Chloroherpetonaceae bacterium]
MKKIALITGAAGNLGVAVVRKFLAEGYHIVATLEPGIDNSAFLAAFPSVETETVDVTLEEPMRGLVQRIVQQHQRLDAGIFLVGGFAMGSLAETDDKALDKMIRLNFKSAFFSAKPVFAQMIQQGFGNLVFIGARAGLDLKSGGYAVAYGFSKSLVFRLAELLNAEGNARGVSASVIVPSIIDTPQNRAAMPNADYKSWIKPEELADAIYFTCSTVGSKLRDTVLKIYHDA